MKGMWLFSKRYFLVYITIALSFLTSCKEEEIIPSDQVLEINEFIWKSLNDIYLWNDMLPQNIDRSREFDPKTYFDKLLFKPTDKWSYITDDYQALINSFKGIEKSFGHEFKLFQIPNSNAVYGVVEYVVFGSPADAAGIMRGDVFYEVNGISLNLDNYSNLLFSMDSYTLSFGEFDQNSQITFKEEKSLTAVVITENPVYETQVLEISSTKIGYLVYNSFINDFNNQLIDAFIQFKNDNIQELILDFRYNLGGSKSAAVLLSSIVAPAQVVENQEIYSRTFWNEQVQQYWIDEEGAESPNLITKFENPEVNLNLDKIYIITSSNTASASELVINCLRPYMEVVIVGADNTRGKYVGSITVHNEETSHGWALQPIVMKAANALGESDYSNGFAPDYVVNDDYNAPLGSLAEDMLAKAVELITGEIITEPARIEASRIPDNIISVPNPRVERKQRLYFELMR